MPAFFGARRALLTTSRHPWTPLKLGSALLAWWDPNQGISYVSNNVSNWSDRVSGLALSASANRPGQNPTTLNGTPVLTFGGSQGLAGTPPASFPTGSLAGVIAVSGTAGTAGSSNPRLAFGYGNTANTGDFRAVASQKASGNVTSGVYVSGSAAYSDTGENWVSLPHFAITSFQGGAAIGQNVDGIPVETGTLSTTPNTSLSTMNLGSNGSYFGWNGTISHVLVIGRLLTTSERQKLEGFESWVTGKNGTNLPPAHPYRSRAPLETDP